MANKASYINGQLAATTTSCCKRDSIGGHGSAVPEPHGTHTHIHTQPVLHGLQGLGFRAASRGCAVVSGAVAGGMGGGGRSPCSMPHA
eukprot:1161918-Pelagomonas_calceolata.AAC.4